MKRSWQLYLVLLLILLAGAAFRLTGLFWGEDQYLHPDERFLAWVGSDISPVQSLSEYFDTANSSLNPHNRGHGFYVYGDFPMILARYVTEWVYGHSGFSEMTNVGRSLSVVMDLLTVLAVFAIAQTAFKDRRLSLLAAAFSAASVLHIQLSHFFTMDTFMVFFTTLAFYFAMRIVVSSNKILLPSLGFGIAIALAAASKLNGASMVLALPAAYLICLIAKPPEQRISFAAKAIIYLLLAGLVSFWVFRLLQPYAFSGPGILNIKPNPQWIANIKELRAQSSGEVDFPPAMQWARRSYLFGGKNLAVWGLGLPLGLLAIAGFIWSGWRMLTDRDRENGQWQVHALLWGWTAFYIIWQSLSQTPSMRYFLPVYPFLAIFAAWGLVALYDWLNHTYSRSATQHPNQRGFVAVLLGFLVLLATFAYAAAFTGIYTRPITRIAASRWIYQNIPGAINLAFQTEDGTYNQPLPFLYSTMITPGRVFTINFQPKSTGVLSQIYLPHVKDHLPSNETRQLNLGIFPADNPDELLASMSAEIPFADEQSPFGGPIAAQLDTPLALDPNRTYTLRIELPGLEGSLPLSGLFTLRIESIDPSRTGDVTHQTLQLAQATLSPSIPYPFDIIPDATGNLSDILVGFQLGAGMDTAPKTLQLKLENPDDAAQSQLVDLLPESGDATSYWFSLSQPLPLIAGQHYLATLLMGSTGGAVTLNGMGIANEGDWDDGLPLRLDGYDGFAGIYPLDLNFNMYWEDTPEKLSRFTRILDESDYIVISSNRQWGSLPRIPERFPMTEVYYRELLGCPPMRSIVWCYSIANPGLFQGKLGYELVKVFESPPQLGSVSFNDQFAEEAFSVYDHPKVFIFRKTENYNPEQVRKILEAVDLVHTVHVLPMKAPPHPANLLLPSNRLAEQTQGGTWSELFNSNAAHNRNQVLAVVVWYLSMALLGFVVYPILRYALPGLSDRGYPMARITGLLLLSYLVWLAGSMRIPFTRGTISLAFLVILLISLYVVYLQRNELRQELRDRWRYFLVIEALTLAFFLTFLLVRLGNPDLWHPWKGGEKPMDFSYFNAILKSTNFPPYDPWYAGGYLNYYYYGFVLVGVLVKWLGIVPALAYNLVLPSIFSLIAMGAFSVSWNLYTSLSPRIKNQEYLVGLAGAFFMAVLGNLGIVKMYYQGYQRLAAPGGVVEGANLLTRWGWALRGMLLTFQGTELPYGIGDWYWNPSRIIPAPGDVEPITEFPYFTTLYGDPHAHLFALPISLLALGLILSIVLLRARWPSRLSGFFYLVLTGLAIGALRPTNTWDFYTYLPLGAIVLAYAVVRYVHWSPCIPSLKNIGANAGKALLAAGAVLALIVVSLILYQPYTDWYALGYRQIEAWKGTHTPTSAYLYHWGLFLFLIISWMTWETREWMAHTPASSLRKLQPVRYLILFLVALLLVLVLILLSREVYIAWLVLPLAAWAGTLILRPNLPDAKRFVLFLVGTGLVLTLVVEVIVLRGDIGRMNTVFKFYLQVWTFFAVSAAASFGWLLSALPDWTPRWRIAWSIGLAALVFGAALYPAMATPAKIKDRMAPDAPHTLDGMAFIPYARYTDEWGEMDLSQDYRAIRWMQENVKGSPVIVEANLRALYRWGSRFSIYTGLPGVVGWEWHQQQQRAVLPGSWVSDRIADVDQFYTTTDLQTAESFLRKYNVSYIILGQQERGHYPGPGLDKFEAVNGVLWEEVYRDGDTVIYKVIS